MAGTLEIDIDFEDIERQAKRFGAAPEIMAEEMMLTMRQSLDLVEQVVVTGTPVNFGLLRGSVGTDIFGEPPDFFGQISTPLTYGRYVEFGRNPGRMPPVSAIKLWVVRKGIATGKEADSVAFLIARSIGRHGTYRHKRPRGARMFEEAFRQTEQPVLDLWNLMVDRVADRLGNE